MSRACDLSRDQNISCSWQTGGHLLEVLENPQPQLGSDSPKHTPRFIGGHMTRKIVGISGVIVRQAFKPGKHSLALIRVKLPIYVSFRSVDTGQKTFDLCFLPERSAVV